jgi:hypothetical protein
VVEKWIRSIQLFAPGSLGIDQREVKYAIRCSDYISQHLQKLLPLCAGWDNTCNKVIQSRIDQLWGKRVMWMSRLNPFVGEMISSLISVFVLLNKVFSLSVLSKSFSFWSIFH